MWRVIAGALLTLLAAWGMQAEPVRADQRILFTPAPLGAGTGGFEQDSSLQPESSAMPAFAIPTPRPRPSAATRPTATAVSPPPRARLSKVDLDYIGGVAGGSGRNAVLAVPQPRAMDFSRGVDLGGVLLGLDTGHGNDSDGAKNLLSPEAKDPIPTDPTIVKKGSPFLGLSLSAPTN